MQNKNQNNWSDLEPEAEISLTEEQPTPKPTPKPEPKPEPIPEKDNSQTVVVSAAKLEIIHRAVTRVEDDLKQLKELLTSFESPNQGNLIFEAEKGESTGDSLEGVFDGEKMIGADGVAYPVPPNYASKSKLVEGDILKLTFGYKGNYIFKQIGPIERRRMQGVLGLDGDDNYWVAVNNQRWRILTASVTYFKAEPGDEVSIVVPKEAQSRWAAVENINRAN